MYSKAINNQKGVALILIAVAIVVLFGFGALAIDVGHLYNVKNQLQAAADAAALAGASEMSGSTFALMADSAYDAADRIALRNVADVAAVDTPLAPMGKPIPVKLNENAGNAVNGDVVLGIWDGTTFAVSSDPELVNAVKVVARRAGANPEQPRVNNWFAKVFSLLPLGPTFDLSSIKAEAIAAREQKLRFTPIMVNEYWHADDIYKNTRPYDDTVHAYPNSFVREKQVNFKGLPQDVTSLAFGYTFAILGARAESNQGSADPNGYVNLDMRSDYYFGGPLNASGDVVPEIYTAKDSTGGCSTNCGNYFNGPGPDQSYETERNGTGIEYLVNGYPSTRLLPTAIYELKRTNYSSNTFASVTSVYNNNFNLKSECPHAVVHYFQTSGTPPLNFSDNIAGSTKVVADYYKAGDRFIALVYDGTHTGGNGGEPHGSVDKLATIVGYVPIEVDGFSGKNPKSIGLSAGTDAGTYALNKSVLEPSWSLASGNPNTMYGHALSDIIQPDVTSPKGGCDFIQKLQEAAKKFSTNRVRLVGTFPDAKYGMAPGQ